MSRNRTLTQLLDDVRWQADQIGATARNDDTHLTRAINQSIQRFREWASENGYPLYLTPNSGTLPVGLTAPYAYGTIDMTSWNPTPVHVYQLEFNINGRIVNLPMVPWEQRNDYQGHLADQFVQGLQVGIPAAFFRYQNTLGIVPASQAAYPYTAWYMPLFADLVNPGDTFDGIAGWEELVVWDVLAKLIVRENLPDQYQMAVTERDRLQKDFEQRLRQDRPSVTRRRDDRGRRQGRYIIR